MENLTDKIEQAYLENNKYCGLLMTFFYEQIVGFRGKQLIAKTYLRFINEVNIDISTKQKRSKILIICTNNYDNLLYEFYKLDKQEQDKHVNELKEIYKDTYHVTVKFRLDAKNKFSYIGLKEYRWGMFNGFGKTISKGFSFLGRKLVGGKKEDVEKKLNNNKIIEKKYAEYFKKYQGHKDYENYDDKLLYFIKQIIKENKFDVKNANKMIDKFIFDSIKIHEMKDSIIMLLGNA